MRLQGIPIPPSVNAAYATNWKTKRRYKSPDLQAWESDFRAWALLNRGYILGVRKMLDTPVDNAALSIDLMFFFSWNRVITKDGRPKILDLDNRLKAVLDAISKVLGVNDSIFFRIRAEKYPVVSSKVGDTVDVSLEWYPVNYFKPWDQAM
jgi:Holliday junction resolvase RusA-like endonuclease